MLRKEGFRLAGTLALVLLLASPLAAVSGSRRMGAEGWLDILWSWVAGWAEEGPAIDPDGRPTTDEGPMSDPDGVKLDSMDTPTTDAGPASDPDGVKLHATDMPTTDAGPASDPNG